MAASRRVLEPKAMRSANNLGDHPLNLVIKPPPPSRRHTPHNTEPHPHILRRLPDGKCAASPAYNPANLCSRHITGNALHGTTANLVDTTVNGGRPSLCVCRVLSAMRLHQHPIHQISHDITRQGSNLLHDLINGHAHTGNDAGFMPARKSTVSPQSPKVKDTANRSVACNLA